jgi:hypothetical protein
MATLAITIPKGSQTGAIIRRWAMQLERMANDIPTTCRPAPTPS